MSTPDSIPARQLTRARGKTPPMCSPLVEALRDAQTSGPGSAIPWGVAGMLVLITAIECFVSRNWLDLTDPVSLSWRYSALAVSKKSAGCDLLCLGDSLLKHGLIPSVVDEGTGRRTVNAAAARAPSLWTYFLLRRALDAGAHPKAIIINAKPAVLLGSLEFNTRYWQEVVSPRECLDLSRMASGGSFILSTIAGRLLPSLRARLEVRSYVLAALGGKADPITAINRVLWRNWSVNGGANVVTALSRSHGESEAEIERRLHPGVFHVDPANAVGLESLFRLAAQRKIPVLWLLPPLTNELQTRRDKSGSEASYERFIRSFAERYPQTLTVLDARRGFDQSIFFSDLTHMSGAGAIALSQSVGAAIDDVLSCRESHGFAAWVTLSVPSDNPVNPVSLVEDLEQSRQMLRINPDAFISSR